MSEDELRNILDEVIRQQKELKDELHGRKRKDIWDKVSIASSFVSGVVLAVLGIFFTHSYNQQQTDLIKQQAEFNKQQVERDNVLKGHQVSLTEIQTVGAFMPYLSGNEENQKMAAILAINEMTNVKLAGAIAELFKGKGAVQAMTAIASSGTQSDKRVANETLAAIASTGNQEERKAAVGAIRMINNNELHLQAPDKSVIKVEVSAEGTAKLVHWNLNGEVQTGDPIVFVLNKAKGDTAILTLFFNFSEHSGGVYKVRMIGGGGTISEYLVRQIGEFVTSRTYTIDVR